MATEETARALAQIAAEANACMRCELYRGARQAVAGAGAEQAEVMLIGEAPSLYDDRRGYPFSGPSGAFLDELLGLAGLSRAEVYLTNVVKHRLPDGHELQASEVAACAGYLTRQVAAVKPLLLVTLGRYALASFLPKARISRSHGQAQRYGGRVLMAMYNPAAALHREELRETVVADFTRALPAALAEARRLASEGALDVTPPDAADDAGESPQQLSLF